MDEATISNIYSSALMWNSFSKIYSKLFKWACFSYIYGNLFKVDWLL